MVMHSSKTKWTASTRAVAEEVDAKFPRNDWTSTYPGHDPHESLAIDFMCNRTMGDKIAEYCWANRKRLGIRYVIWYGRIISETSNTPNRWVRYFAADDPNPSKSHKNHVHVSRYKDGSYVPAAKPVTMYVKEDGTKGYSFDGKVVGTRNKGHKLTGTARTSSSGKYLVTNSNVWFPWPRLSATKPTTTTTPVVVKPPVVKPNPTPVVTKVDKEISAPKDKIIYVDLLKPGTKDSASVYHLQTLLNRVNAKNVVRNGDYNEETRESVRVFQRMMKDDVVDGDIGKQGLLALIRKAGRGYQSYKVEDSSK